VSGREPEGRCFCGARITGSGRRWCSIECRNRDRAELTGRDRALYRSGDPDADRRYIAALWAERDAWRDDG
jgi:hypothetical protein